MPSSLRQGYEITSKTNFLTKAPRPTFTYTYRLRIKNWTNVCVSVCKQNKVTRFSQHWLNGFWPDLCYLIEPGVMQVIGKFHWDWSTTRGVIYIKLFWSKSGSFLMGWFLLSTLSNSISLERYLKGLSNEEKISKIWQPYQKLLALKWNSHTFLKSGVEFHFKNDFRNHQLAPCYKGIE